MCVCVCGGDRGEREGKGEKGGRPNTNTIRPEAGRLLSTSLHAAAQWSK